MRLPGSVAAAFCATLADEWARAGVSRAVVCPGSRSTPLAVALVAEPRMEVEVRLDERGAAFFALGMALASGRPVVLLTTSGTAAAELHAGVVEAHQARVPLLVCTADRPPELHHVGAPQTIDQGDLFGRAVRLALDPGVADDSSRETWRSLASRAVAEATCGPFGPGPVHLNLAFREPLLAEAGPLPGGRPDGEPWHAVSRGTAAARGQVEELARLLSSARRGLVVAGGGAGAPEPGLLKELAWRLGWAVLADPRAGCGTGPPPHRPGAPPVVGAADAILRHEGFAAAMRPDVVLRVGSLPASKVLATWMQATALGGARHIGIDPYWAWQDPGRELSRVVSADPDELLAGVLAELGPRRAERGEWAEGWALAESLAQEAVDGVLAAHEEATEPGVARLLYARAEASSTIVASSSMPVRDLEWFARPRSDPPRVLANRGANGIDGVVSTLLGVAAASPGRTYGLIGDLALLHDASALASGASDGGPLGDLRCVVLDNAGGGIFSFLPQARELDPERFEQLFGTPQRPEIATLLRAYGYSCAELDTLEGIEGALEGEAEGFVVVRTDRRANVRVHDEIAAAVRAGIDGSSLTS